MQDRQYFVLVLAHSLHGRLRRIHIPHQTIYAVMALALLGFFSVLGFFTSYLRMTWKVSHYNSLRQEVDTLRARYKELQKVTNQQHEQLASLELVASEVSVAYGLQSKMESNRGGLAASTGLEPTYQESIKEYNLLKTSTLSRLFRNYPKQWLTHIRPSLWPVQGRILSPFGTRNDPFSGDSSNLHGGVDLEAAVGTPVHASADGVVVQAEWSGRFGKLVIIDHGNGVQTYYAHLSRFEVVPGQEIRSGQLVGLSGSTGHATGPHLHYEVRVHGNPVNPYPYLSRSGATVLAASSGSRNFGF